jgi:hypothetical protein
MQHRGVALDDSRNAGPIAFFAPKEVTRELLRQRLTVAMRGKNAADVEAAVDRGLDKIAGGPIRPDPRSVNRSQRSMAASTPSDLRA